MWEVVNSVIGTKCSMKFPVEVCPKLNLGRCSCILIKRELKNWMIILNRNIIVVCRGEETRIKALGGAV